MGFLARRWLLGVADFAVTLPVVRWTWTGPGEDDLAGSLDEFRPTDRESVLEMTAGRYLLASKLIDTHGVSPFSVETENTDWLDELHAFSWLRHFRDARNDEERKFARTLVLDWIGREGRFDRYTWRVSLCARRILNWLRNYALLTEGAAPDQLSTITRSLSMQVQSLKLRGGLAPEPVDSLLAAMALLGVAICDDPRTDNVTPRVRRVRELLDQQLDADGLHKSRSAKVQLQLLTELVTLHNALRRHREEHGREFADTVEQMHKAFDFISLGTGEPAYFNGTGQLPHDIIVAVQAQSTSRARATGLTGGYGRLVAGRAIVVADSGVVPPPEYAHHAHASALAFEFSYGRDLVVCNCGPAPVELDERSGMLFRQGIAHAAPTINAISAATVKTRGAMAGRLIANGARPVMTVDIEETALALTTYGYADKFNVVIERRLTLLAEGKTLVGQDKLVQGKSGRVSGACAIRFHLAAGTEVTPVEDMLRLKLSSGATWSFLWEGAEMRIEDSVRQSAYFGFHRTRQIVLDAAAADGPEISWIFTLEEKT